MEIIVSVSGRFHGFNLAQQLLKKGYLHKLITSYPKFEVKKYGIPPEKVESILIKEILERGWRSLPKFINNLYNPYYFIHRTFDRLASRKIDKSDIFVGFSSVSLYSLKKAEKMGAVGVLDSGSSHILFRKEIMEEEYGKYGVKLEVTHPLVIKRELEEYQAADYIVIPSLFAKRTFLEKGVPEEKIIHVPYGVDLSDFRQIPKSDNIFRVVYVGGMSLRKGVHYLLQAFSELKLPNSELMLVGSINDEIKPFFKKYEGSFSWTGSKPQKELYKYYSQGSVFVLNSIEDGFGLVIIHAMACGLPVIYTTNTGGEDIARDGKEGFMIPIRDVEKLKEKILYLYKDPEIRGRMGQSAKERVSAGFTWDDYGNHMIKAYKNIISVKNNKK